MTFSLIQRFWNSDKIFPISLFKSASLCYHKTRMDGIQLANGTGRSRRQKLYRRIEKTYSFSYPAENKAGAFIREGTRRKDIASLKSVLPEHNNRPYREDFTEEGCKLNIGFIGAGKAGVSLGKYFAVHEGSSTNATRATVKGYYSRSSESAQDAARFTNSQAYDTMPGILRECDTIFLTVPDGKIKAVWKELSRHDLQGKLICHCSGAMSSREAFTGIEETGAYGYSIHPLFAISDK